MSSPGRVLAILDLFTVERPVWPIDEINAAQGHTRATGYRYVKELVEAGLLQKVSAGRYALGARIIELDYQIRRTDPVLHAASAPMAALSAESGFDTVLSVLFEGPKVVDVHRVSGSRKLQLAFGRGHPRPLFKAAAPKVLLAGLPRPRLLELHRQHAAQIAAHGLGDDWNAFRQYLADIRREGFYLSLGESEPGIAGAAMPVHNADGEVVAALALVGTEAAIRRAGRRRLVQWLGDGTARIETALRAVPAR